MQAHELATLNETREENAELKRTTEHLRTRNENLLARNVVLNDTVAGTTLALDSLFKAIRQVVGTKTYNVITQAAREISGAPAKDIKPNKRNRPLKVVPQ